MPSPTNAPGPPIEAQQDPSAQDALILAHAVLIEKLLFNVQTLGRQLIKSLRKQRGRK